MLQWAFCTKVGSVTTVMLPFALITCGLCLHDQVPKTRFGARVFSPVVRELHCPDNILHFFREDKIIRYHEHPGEKKKKKKTEGIKRVIGAKGTLCNWQV